MTTKDDETMNESTQMPLTKTAPTTLRGTHFQPDGESSAALVLVVDDNEDNRAVLTRMLEHGGYQVIQAANGHQAIERAARDAPGLILMDLSMPGMDGWTATGLLKNDDSLCHTPVIVVTGHLTRDEIERAREVGCQDIVSKPIDYYVLIDKVRHHTGTMTRSV